MHFGVCILSMLGFMNTNSCTVKGQICMLHSCILVIMPLSCEAFGCEVNQIAEYPIFKTSSIFRCH